MIIAIDGPAASGKGTLGKRLAAHYGLRHLDTGLIYRAVAKALLDAGDPLDDRPGDGRRARARSRAVRRESPQEPRDRRGRLDRVGHPGGAGGAARLPARVRPAAPGAVLDGRDIGTVIFPDADVKIFVDRHPGGAGPPPRRSSCRRRATRVSEADILADIRRRDERDTSRAAAPLKPAPDAHLLDTTHLDIDAAFRAAVDIVEAVRAGRKRG